MHYFVGYQGDDATIDVMPVLKTGRGRIISSGTVVTGIQTMFMLQLDAGDIIQIYHPTRLISVIHSVMLIIESSSSPPF